MNIADYKKYCNKEESQGRNTSARTKASQPGTLLVCRWLNCAR